VQQALHAIIDSVKDHCLDRHGTDKPDYRFYNGRQFAGIELRDNWLRLAFFKKLGVVHTNLPRLEPNEEWYSFSVDPSSPESVNEAIASIKQIARRALVRVLDRTLSEWLDSVASNWDSTVDEVAAKIGWDEIINRMKAYPLVSATLSAPELSIEAFAEAIGECWVLGQQQDRIRFRRFVEQESRSTSAVKRLISDFPDDDGKAADRIDAFIEEATALGIATDKGNPDWAGAALLASVILTSLYPDRFIDFRRRRWENMARTLGYRSRTRSSRKSPTPFPLPRESLRHDRLPVVQGRRRGSAAARARGPAGAPRLS
jgi:hypothetical protein